MITVAVEMTAMIETTEKAPFGEAGVELDLDRYEEK